MPQPSRRLTASITALINALLFRIDRWRTPKPDFSVFAARSTAPAEVTAGLRSAPRENLRARGA